MYFGLPSIVRFNKLSTLTLTCGVLAPMVYVITDKFAGLGYPGYSFTAQAVSELFAIGAPTSHLVVWRAYSFWHLRSVYGNHLKEGTSCVSWV